MVQVSLRVQPVGLSGLQQGKDRGAGVGTGLGVAEQPVLPADGNRADGVLYLVVADLDLAVVEERAKVLPTVQEVIPKKGIAIGSIKMYNRNEHSVERNSTQLEVRSWRR